MAFICAKVRDFGSDKKYEQVGATGYYVLSAEAQELRMGERASLSKLYKLVKQQKDFSPDEELTLQELTSPALRQKSIQLIRELKVTK